MNIITNFINLLNSFKYNILDEFENNILIYEYIYNLLDSLIITKKYSFNPKSIDKNKIYWSRCNFYIQPTLLAYLEDHQLIFKKPKFNINSLTDKYQIESHDLFKCRSNISFTVKQIIHNYKGCIVIKFIIYKLFDIINTKTNNSEKIPLYEKISKILGSNRKEQISKISFIESYLNAEMIEFIDDNINDNIINEILNNFRLFNTNYNTCATNNLFGNSLYNINILLNNNTSNLSKNIYDILDKYKNNMDEFLLFISLCYYRLYNYQYAICYLLTSITYHIQKHYNVSIDRFINCDFNDTSCTIMTLFDIQRSLFNEYINNIQLAKSNNPIILKDPNNDYNKMYYFALHNNYNIRKINDLSENDRNITYSLLKHFNQQNISSTPFTEIKTQLSNPFDFNYIYKLIKNDYHYPFTLDTEHELCYYSIIEWYLNIFANEYGFKILHKNELLKYNTLKEIIANIVNDNNTVIISYNHTPNEFYRIGHYTGFNIYISTNNNSCNVIANDDLDSDFRKPSLYTIDIDFENILLIQNEIDNLNLIPIYAIINNNLNTYNNRNIYAYDLLHNTFDSKMKKIDVLDRFIGGACTNNFLLMVLVIIIIVIVIIIIIKYKRQKIINRSK